MARPTSKTDKFYVADTEENREFALDLVSAMFAAADVPTKYVYAWDSLAPQVEVDTTESGAKQLVVTYHRRLLDDDGKVVWESPAEGEPTEPAHRPGMIVLTVGLKVETI